MRKIMHAFRSVSYFFRAMHRYAQGGEPIPKALDALAEYLASREELSAEDWASEVRRSATLSREIALFAYNFLASFHIPVGRIRSEDRVKEDLHLNEALQDDWDEELVDEFKRCFGKNLAFTKWPRIITVGDLLLFLDRKIAARRPSSPWS